jgi:regulator of protease activity HflC (stomatin/prohibitin superfamily)
LNKRSIQKNGLVNLLALLVVGIAGFAVARSSNTMAGLASLCFIAVGILVSLVSWFQMRLEERERQERLELEGLAKGHPGAALFETREAELFPVRRSREQFDRFFVPIFTVLVALAQLAGAYFLWRWLKANSLAPELREPSMALSLFALFGLVLFLLGKFSATIARLEDHRLLRPGASYLLLGAYLSAAVAVGIILVQIGLPRADLVVGYVLCGLLALVGVETVLNLLLELYRPRVKGKIGRPLYESRLVGLLAHPEGLITTAAQALDYQFGFKVSETWFYRLFVEKALAWLILLQLAALLISTMIVIIEPGEQALLERFGKPVDGRTLLNPGLHIVWPWPVDKVRRYRTEQIQSFEIGTPEGNEPEAGAVLWTVAHHAETNFLVANRMQWTSEVSTNAAGEVSSKQPPPISLITGSIPIQFQIKDLMAWEYNNEDSQSLLEDLAYREVVRFLAGVDMNEIMSYGRGPGAEELKRRVQEEADKRKLGARILAVGLQDLHPPVKVAPEYEKVVGAAHTKEAKILAARADQIKTNAVAEAQATNVINVASADSVRTATGAAARAGLFTNQVAAYDAARSVYAERLYLQSLVRSTAGARKYVLLTTNTHDVLQFDLQEKIRTDILNDVLVAPKK